MYKFALIFNAAASVVNIVIIWCMYRSPYALRLRNILRRRYRIGDSGIPSTLRIECSLKKLTPKNWIK